MSPENRRRAGPTPQSARPYVSTLTRYRDRPNVPRLDELAPRKGME